MESVKSQVILIEDQQLKYPAWVEVQVGTNVFIADLTEQLDKLKINKPFIEHFFTRQLKIKTVQVLDVLTEEALVLTDLDPKTVFLKKCQGEFGDDDYFDLIRTFDKALEQFAQQEDKS